MVIRILSLLILILTCPQSRAEEIAEIPLSEIWANDMPGTKKLGELKCDKSLSARECGEYYSGMFKAVQFNKQGETAKKGFAVGGTGLAALREVHRVFVEKAEPPKILSHGQEITPVFFTHEIHPYVRLQKVEVFNGKINVRYKFIPHETEDMSQYLALIPLGRLPIGKHHVDFVLSELDPEFAGGWFERTKNKHARLCLCGAFSFSIGECPTTQQN